jgi:hypothetical protein
MVSFPQTFPPTPCSHLYPSSYAPHALPISFVSILPPANSMFKDSNCVSVFFKFLLRHSRRGTLSSVIKKSRCTWWLQYTQLMIWRWPSQNTFGMWTVLYWTRSLRTQFGVSINFWKLAGDTLNITCNFLCCNHQVHRDFLITLHITQKYVSIIYCYV